MRILIDRGIPNYINKFKLKMLPPTTQEELDRRENLAAKVQLTKDTMDMLDGIEDNVAKLKILKSLLSEYITDTEVISIIQAEIDKLEAEVGDGEENSSEEEEELASDEETLNEPIDIGGIGTEEEEEAPANLSDAVNSDVLPTPEELGQDFTDNSNF